MDDILKSIRADWSWTMPAPVRICRVSKFGNVVVLVEGGAVWRICPEELSATVIAAELAELEPLLEDPEFIADWDLGALVAEAEEMFGVQPSGRCFCLRMPSVLGGKYTVDNVGTNSVAELVSFAGDVARQIDDVPDGGQVKFKWGV